MDEYPAAISLLLTLGNGAFITSSNTVNKVSVIPLLNSRANCSMLSPVAQELNIADAKAVFQAVFIGALLFLRPAFSNSIILSL